MNVSRTGGVLAGVVIAGAIVVVAMRPSALAPHPTATPSLERPLAASADEHTLRRAAAPLPARATVYVAGAVAHPGVYALAADARAIDAVARAGGMTHDADSLAVNLAAHVTDGEEIAVPHVGEALPASAIPADAAPPKKHSRRGHRRRAKPRADAAAIPPSQEARVQRIDLNAADASTLATIPGIGETLAERIVAFRAANGPFASVDGLADVSGITPSRFDAIASFLTVGSP